VFISSSSSVPFLISFVWTSSTRSRVIAYRFKNFLRNTHAKRAQEEEHAPREVSVSRKRVYESSSSSAAAANDSDSDDVVHPEAILSHERPERLSATKASVDDDDNFILSTTDAFNIRSNVDCDPRFGSPSHARGTTEQREIGTRENTKRERKETLVGSATRGDVREDSKSERGALCFETDGDYEEDESGSGRRINGFWGCSEERNHRGDSCFDEEEEKRRGGRGGERWPRWREKSVRERERQRRSFKESEERWRKERE